MILYHKLDSRFYLSESDKKRISEIVLSLRKEGETFWELMPSNHPKEFDELVSTLKFKNVCGIVIADFRTNSYTAIHSDYIAPGRSHYAAKIPITNCKQVEFIWYRVLDESKIRYVDVKGEEFKAISPEDAELVDKITLDEPYLCDTRHFHVGGNLTDGYEITLSVRFVEQPGISIEQFQDYITA